MALVYFLNCNGFKANGLNENDYIVKIGSSARDSGQGGIDPHYQRAKELTDEQYASYVKDNDEYVQQSGFIYYIQNNNCQHVNIQNYTTARFIESHILNMHDVVSDRYTNRNGVYEKAVELIRIENKKPNEIGRYLINLIIDSNNKIDIIRNVHLRVFQYIRNATFDAEDMSCSVSDLLRNSYRRMFAEESWE